MGKGDISWDMSATINYPLVNWHNYGESQFLMGKSTINGQLSMAIVYQMVYAGLYETENPPDRPSQKGKTMDVYQLLKIFSKGPLILIIWMICFWLLTTQVMFVALFTKKSWSGRSLDLSTKRNPSKTEPAGSSRRGLDTPQAGQTCWLLGAALKKRKVTWVTWVEKNHSCRGPKYPNWWRFPIVTRPGEATKSYWKWP